MAASPRSRSRRSSARQSGHTLPRSTPEAIRAFRMKSPRLRLISVWMVLIAGMIGLTGRLAFLQLVRGDELKAMAAEQQAIQTTPRASRRQLIDRQGNVVALDQVLYTLYVHPMLFQKAPETIASALEEVLETSVLEDDERSLVEQFSDRESGIKLATDISEETAKRVRSLRLDGLDLLPSPQRTYPQGELFAQVTGYTDLEGVPKEGVELAYQSQLTYPEVESSGKAASLQLVTRDDSRLQLTIDSRLQRIAQENLAATVAEYNAKRGALIVMDSHTGEILTMAIAPTYNPNEYYDANIEYFKNWAVSDLYEPGSTFKPINVAIALENGAISANDTIYDEGKIQVGEWPIQNVDFKYIGGRGAISITDVLRYSSNVGMVHIMEKMQRSAYYEWLEKLGIGRNTNSDLPGKTSGQIKDRDQFVNSAVEAATTSFGQGFSLTPLQLVQLHGTLANGGTMVTPHVVRGMVNSDNELTWTPERTEAKQVFSPGTTQQVLQMMQEVVDNGTGAAAKIDGYQIAGKTGTAQKATEYGSYGNQRITSFVSIAPVSDPRYVILAVVDEPKGENAYGGTVAAPLVKKMLDSLVVLEGVTPDQPTGQSTDRPTDQSPVTAEPNANNSSGPTAEATP